MCYLLLYPVEKDVNNRREGRGETRYALGERRHKTAGRFTTTTGCFSRKKYVCWIQI